MDASLATALGLGFVLGLRHAADADHVVAVSTLVSQRVDRSSPWVLGASWGIGHALALLAVGLLVVAFGLAIQDAVERGLEAIVSTVLVLLGAQALLTTAASLRVHGHRHSHRTCEHSHLHRHAGGEDAHEHAHPLRAAGRPFLVGVMHGLAGSAALAIVVLASIPSALHQVAYIVLFGAGSTAGMLILSSIMAASLARTAGRRGTAGAAIQAATGAGSMLLGVLRLAGLG